MQHQLGRHNFGMKYLNKDNVDHLLHVLQQNYLCNTNWEGTCYLGLILYWDYNKRNVHLSMPSYILKTLKHFTHNKPTTPQHQTHLHRIPMYPPLFQYATLADILAPLSNNDKMYIQQVVGTLLWLSS
jgi:hypothetical protein